MSTDHKRVVFLTLIMVVACASIISITMIILYDIHIEEVQARLVVTAQSQARLMEAVARFDAVYSKDYPGGSEKATLSQIINAHRDYKGFGETGEFTLAKR